MKEDSIKITFLGTGTSSGVPMIGCDCAVCTSGDPKDNRLRSSILVNTPGFTFVIDTTPDFRYQMLRTKTKTLNAVVFTHAHKDHIAGLDDVRAFNYLMKKPMNVYASARTNEALKKDFYYAFGENKYPGVPELILHTIDETPFAIGNTLMEPILVWHHKMEVYGFRFNDFTYITDANKIDEDQKKKIIGSKVLVLNALRREPHISHFTLSEAIALAEELNIPEVYFTHISHQLGLHKDVEAELPPHIHLAYDGLEINI